MKTTGTDLERRYSPAEQKTVTGALSRFCAQEFPQLAGSRARQAVVQAIASMVHQFFPETSH